MENNAINWKRQFYYMSAALREVVRLLPEEHTLRPDG
jgi:hypothetical protein